MKTFLVRTDRYVPRVLATLLILKDPGQYGFDLGEREEPISFEVVAIEKQVRLDAIARELGISEALLSDLNPKLRLRVTPSKLLFSGFHLRCRGCCLQVLTAYQSGHVSGQVFQNAIRRVLLN